MFSVAKILRMAHPLVSDHVTWPSPKLSNRPANCFHRPKGTTNLLRKTESALPQSSCWTGGFDLREAPRNFSVSLIISTMDPIIMPQIRCILSSVALSTLSFLYLFSSQNLSQTKNPPVVSIISKKNKCRLWRKTSSTPAKFDTEALPSLAAELLAQVLQWWVLPPPQPHQIRSFSREQWSKPLWHSILLVGL